MQLLTWEFWLYLHLFKVIDDKVFWFIALPVPEVSSRSRFLFSFAKVGAFHFAFTSPTVSETWALGFISFQSYYLSVSRWMFASRFLSFCCSEQCKNIWVKLFQASGTEYKRARLWDLLYYLYVSVSSTLRSIFIYFYFFHKPKGQLCLEDPGRKCTGRESVLPLDTDLVPRQTRSRPTLTDQLWYIVKTDHKRFCLRILSKIYITQTFGDPRVLRDNKSFPESRTSRTKPQITLRRVIFFFCSLSHSAAQDKNCSDKNKSKQLWMASS